METVSTKVPAPIKEQLDDMADEIGESRSIVIRNLLREGLEDDKPADTESTPFGVWMSFIGWMLAAAAFLDAPESVGIAGLGIAVGGLLIEKTGVDTWFQEVRTDESADTRQ